MVESEMWGMLTCGGREIKEEQEKYYTVHTLLEIKATTESEEKRGEGYRRRMLLQKSQEEGECLIVSSEAPGQVG